MKRFLYPFVIIVVVSVVVLIAVYVLGRCTTVVLIRHAEKVDMSANSNLHDPVGLARAQALVGVLGEAGIQAIYTTDYCRTAQTAQYLASELGLSLNVQQSEDPDAGLDNCQPDIIVPVNHLPTEVATSADLVEFVLGEHSNQSVLIVGHSPTIPPMVAALGAGTFASVGPVDYDNLFVVELHEWYGSRRIIKARYGD